jgi:formate hydrogenlyase transcriptional activator
MMWKNSNQEPEKPQVRIIGTSQPLASVMKEVAVVALTSSTVLIQGETGTGKELIAQAVHNLSPRRTAAFVKVNCAAIPATLIESELFGHERGAFTGALTQRIGRFEMASGGTLFLDEIGDLALDLQVKLLRVLQDQEFERLGGSRTIRVNVRLVTATNRDLSRMVDDKEFRADLFYRLSVFPISLPPLRDRTEDIPALARHFLAGFAERMNKVVEHIPARTMEAMLAYDWPGNIRELQNFMERGVILSPGSIFQPPFLPTRRQTTNVRTTPKILDDATRDHVLQTLEETKWVVGGGHGAAARLGVARTTLISRMRRLGIDLARGDSKNPHRVQAFQVTA